MKIINRHKLLDNFIPWFIFLLSVINDLDESTYLYNL